MIFLDWKSGNADKENFLDLKNSALNVLQCFFVFTSKIEFKHRSKKFKCLRNDGNV